MNLPVGLLTGTQPVGPLYLADLKNQTDNLRLLLESVEADLSDRRERAALTDTTHAWLLRLRRRLAEIEEDTQEAFRERRQLVKLLVNSISIGKRQEDGRTEIRISYRFGPPASSGAPEEDSSVGGVKNGSLSYLTNRRKSGKNLLVVTGLREKEARGSSLPLPGSRSVISTFSESNSMTL